jgi:GNAT superfamily N-acetyltransferase
MFVDESVRVDEVRPDSIQFDGVKALSRKHQTFLGHLPWEAFSDAAGGGRLLAALVDDDVVVGYCLYRVRKRDRSVSLTHVCVADGWRGRGVARLLVEAVVERNPFASVVVAKCRADYPAAKLWPALHFALVGSTPGKGAAGTVLERWVRQLDENTLFAFQADDRAVVAIDTDVVRDIAEPRSEFVASIALVDDWVDEVAELVTVPNVETEISRAKADVPGLTGALGRFRQLLPDPVFADAARRSIDESPISPAVRGSDRLNVAQATAGGADLFVTRDQALLGSASVLSDVVGVEVLSPADLLLRLHAGLHADDYRPSALVRTSIEVATSASVPSTESLTALVDHEIGEPARPFRRELERCVASVGEHGRIQQATDDGGRLVAILAERFSDTEGVLHVDAIRVATDRDRYAIARQLAYLSRQSCIDRGGDLVVAAGHVPEYAARALRDEGFVFGEEGWFARCDRRLLTATDASPDANHGLTVADLTPMVISRLERERWPLRLFGGSVPTYVVPIRPAWAQALFDHDPPQQLLLHRDRRLGLSREHVYYKSKATFIQAPARLLWYVSTDDPNAGIRAWSWLDSAETDRPGSLYQRFGSQGVFTRAAIEASAGKLSEATALSFSRTELFPRHLTLRRCQELVSDFRTSGFLTTTRAISEHSFETLYREGMGAP